MRDRDYLAIKKTILIAFFILTIIITGVLFSLSILKDETISNHLKIAKLHSKVFSDNLAQTLENIDFLVKNIETILNVNSSFSELSNRSDSVLQRSLHIRSVSVVDATDEIIFSSNRKNLGIFIDIDKFYPKPFFNRWILRFGNPWRGRDISNGFEVKEPEDVKPTDLTFFLIAKEIVVDSEPYKILFSVNSDYFINLFNQNLDSEIGFVDVLSIYNRVIFSTDESMFVGSEVKNNHILEVAKERNRESGVIYFDKKETIVSYQLIDRFPFIISVRLNYDRALQTWEEKRYNFLLIINSLILLCIILVSLLVVKFIRNRDRESKLQKAQIEHHKRFKTIFEESSIFAIVLDSDGLVLNANHIFLESIDKKIADILNQKIYEIEAFDEDSRGWLKRYIHSFLKIEDSSKELNILENNSIKTIDFNLSHISLEDRSELVLIGFDITDTIKVTKELKVAKELAESSSKSKSEFLANVSHEIRTPLNGIIGLTNLALKDTLSSKQRDYLKKSLSSADTLLRLINDILDYSKLEADKIELESRVFNLDETIETIKNLFEYQAQQRGLSFEFKIDFRDRFFIGDSFRLVQILTNLIGNSIKFTKIGGIKVTISLLSENLAKDERELKFSVEDSGIGMSEQEREGIFQEFTQVDSSISRKYGGTGLGLSISKKLVENMQGKIWCESKKNIGTTIFFTTILKIAKEKIASENEISNNIDFADMRDITILVVEDNEINQLVTNELLKSFGILIENAENGLEATKKAELKEYNLILMDLQMPIMDGFEASKIVKESTINKNTPIVALSAGVLDKDIKSAKEAGLDDYLAKPVDREKLFLVLKKWLKLTPKEQKINLNSVDLEIDGLDLKELIDRVGESREVIKNLLLKFAKDYQNIENLLNIDTLEKEAFDRDMHSLKGVSGNLSLYKIHQLSKEIYESSDFEKREKLLPVLKNLIRKTINKINSSVISNKVEYKNSSSKDDIKEFIDEIFKDLDSFRVIREDRVEKLLSLLGDFLDESRALELESFLKNFKYRDAKEILKEIKNSF